MLSKYSFVEIRHTRIADVRNKETLLRNEIQVVEDPITALVGKNGMLERVVFASPIMALEI